MEDLRRILAGGGLPITYIDRAVFELTPPREKSILSFGLKSTVSFPFG